MSILGTLRGQSKRILVSSLLVIFSGAIGYAFFQLTQTSVLKTEHQAKVYHVGILSAIDVFAPAAKGFKSKMTELGYIEGKNVVYEEVHHDNDRVANEQALRNFVDHKVDLIFVFPTGAALQAKEVTAGTKIPVVFDYSSIDSNSLVESLAHPGGNLTGVRYASGELTAKRFEILHELMPKLKNLWIIYNPDYPTMKSALGALKPIVASTQVSLKESTISNIDDLKKILDEKDKKGDTGVDAILILPEPITQSPEGWKLIVAFAKKHNLPIAGSAAYQTDSGAIFSYIQNTEDSGRLSATVADKILRGSDPSLLPILTPEPILRFNYTQAKSLGITASEGFLGTVNEIIR